MALPKTLDKSDKFAGSKFEQPIGWPAGRKPGMVFVAKLSRLSVREPTLKNRRVSDTKFLGYSKISSASEFPPTPPTTHSQTAKKRAVTAQQ